MSLQTSLMDISTSFPIEYSFELNCSEDNLQKNIQEVASFVSKVYAKFPKLSEEGREQLRKLGVIFTKLKELPSSSECEQFETALKERIIADLNQKKDYCSIMLSTDYFPEKELCEVARAVFQQKNELGFLFPYKTCTSVCLRNKKTKLCVNMNFKGSLV